MEAVQGDRWRRRNRQLHDDQHVGTFQQGSHEMVIHFNKVNMTWLQIGLWLVQWRRQRWSWGWEWWWWWKQDAAWQCNWQLLSCYSLGWLDGSSIIVCTTITMTRKMIKKMTKMMKIGDNSGACDSGDASEPGAASTPSVERRWQDEHQRDHFSVMLCEYQRCDCLNWGR